MDKKYAVINIDDNLQFKLISETATLSEAVGIMISSREKHIGTLEIYKKINWDAVEK